ncbi:MAG: response regulator [Elusimicrobia bacterium]|nr:response regulator [Elusimicrobiota bacterium]
MDPVKVLLVDDEEEFTKTLSERMEARGLKVRTASSGPAALELLKGMSFDAIVLDMMMPGMDGIETLRRIRELDASLQIILLTGRGDIQKSVEAMKLGAMDFLEKPVDLGKLMEVIRAAQERKRGLDRERTQKSIDDILDSKGW